MTTDDDTLDVADMQRRAFAADDEPTPDTLDVCELQRRALAASRSRAASVTG